MQEDIDKRYFNREVDEAVEEISKYGDFNWFVGDDGVAPGQHRIFHGAIRRKKQQEILT